MDGVAESEVRYALDSFTRFRFDSAACEEIDQFCEEEFSRPVKTGERSVDQSASQLLVAAAEFSLIDTIPELCIAGLASVNKWPEGDIWVGVENVWKAELKSDCHMGWFHPGFAGYPEAGAAVFSADVGRMRIANHGDGFVGGVEDVVVAVERMEKAHGSHPAKLFQMVAKSGFLRLQGVLWCAQFSIMGVPGFPQSARDAVRIVCDRLEI
ncbi:hypothetical protein [Streptomyces zaomyceticus]|uniref:hypothetical protein n=1 Tax=Streptomyces zaomyceticus TaxID=68286 RepID=UPI00342AF41A